MAKKDKKIESIGTAGGGTSWSHPLATETEDGARIVYVAVPNEDSIQAAAAYQALRAEREPRINALTTMIGLRQFDFKDKGIEEFLAEAAKVEDYIRNGTVPAKAEESPVAKGTASHFHGDEECFENHGLGVEGEEN